MSNSLQPHGRQTPLSMGFSRHEYWVGCHSLLKGIFPTQGSKPDLLHCRRILYHLSHQGSPWSDAKASQWPLLTTSPKGQTQVLDLDTLLWERDGTAVTRRMRTATRQSGLEEAWEACLGFTVFFLICFWFCVQWKRADILYWQGLESRCILSSIWGNEGDSKKEMIRHFPKRSSRKLH